MRQGACFFDPVTFTLAPARLLAEKRVDIPQLKSYVADGGTMDQVVEQVVDSKAEIVELSLAELAQVGGGAVAVDFS